MARFSRAAAVRSASASASWPDRSRASPRNVTAKDERVDDSTVEALERAAQSGRTLLLVTGRELDDVERVAPRLDVFERVVAENGGLLYGGPAYRDSVPLADPPPERLVSWLRERDVAPLGVGAVMVATRQPHDVTVLEAIRELGLEQQLIYNKGAVMVLPPGVNKASGLGKAVPASAAPVARTATRTRSGYRRTACGCSSPDRPAAESRPPTAGLYLVGIAAGILPTSRP